jgi:cytosine/adenosine deaminase-related metal-dependent hydrolase
MISIYSANWVLPISSSPIEDGAVVVDGSIITYVGTQHEAKTRFPNAQVHHFGNASILPGLINCHSHFDLTIMRGYLEPQEQDFFSWLRQLTTAKRALTKEDLYISAMWGAIEAVRAGITYTADVSDNAESVLPAFNQIGLRATLYQECFGPDPKAAHENFKQICDQISSLKEHETSMVRIGISPHAPYTVSGPLLEMIAEYASTRALPVMMHAAESTSEDLFIKEGKGAFVEKLAERGIEWKATGLSTIQYLKKLGLFNTDLLLAHCIRTDEIDIEIIRDAHAGVAHCPKSNAKLGHDRAPYQLMIERKLKVGLGTDSVASNNTCDVLEEARFALLFSRINTNSGNKNNRIIKAEESLFTATKGGAEALNCNLPIGQLAENSPADLVIVSLNGVHQLPINEDPVNALVFSSSGRDVVLTMVNGKELFRDGQVLTVNENYFRERIRESRLKLNSVI